MILNKDIHNYQLCLSVYLPLRITTTIHTAKQKGTSMTEENCIQKLNFHKYRLQLHDGAPSKADKVAYRRELN